MVRGGCKKEPTTRWVLRHSKATIVVCTFWVMTPPAKLTFQSILLTQNPPPPQKNSLSKGRGVWGRSPKGEGKWLFLKHFYFESMRNILKLGWSASYTWTARLTKIKVLRTWQISGHTLQTITSERQKTNSGNAKRRRNTQCIENGQMCVTVLIQRKDALSHIMESSKKTSLSNNNNNKKAQKT